MAKQATLELEGAEVVVRQADDAGELTEAAAAAIEEHGHVMLVGGSGKTLRAVSLAMAAWRKQQRQLEDLLEALMPSFSELPGEAAVLQARRNAEARRELLEEFGALTSAGVADLAGSTAANRAALANRWRKEGLVFAVRLDDELLYPVFQFSAEGRPRPVIAEVLAALGKAGELSDWQRALWFTSSSGWLSGRRPVDALDDAPEAVTEAARREAELVS
jgi:hypothetical protein